MIKKLFEFRFELFFGSLLAILFGSLLVPLKVFDNIIQPILFQINICFGILLISKKKKLSWFFIMLFVAAAIVFGLNLFLPEASKLPGYIQLVIYFLFYITVTIDIIKQVWGARKVGKNVIIGLMSGYVSLGLVAFFIFMSIEIIVPNSFQGLLMATAVGGNSKVDSLIYYSYITLLTIGYGEIIPVTPVAQKAAILVGLMGQFYLVIITAVVVEKYIRHAYKEY